ncbi:hypothetical protein ARMSODRAFT_980064, partial [Armillaria solidipes]
TVYADVSQDADPAIAIGTRLQPFTLLQQQASSLSNREYTRHGCSDRWKQAEAVCAQVKQYTDYLEDMVTGIIRNYHHQPRFRKPGPVIESNCRQGLFDPQLTDLIQQCVPAYLAESEQRRTVWIQAWAVELHWKYPEFMASPRFVDTQACFPGLGGACAARQGYVGLCSGA